jgi:outer membrane protein assembly factor BamB
VVEYDKNFNQIWSYPIPSPWAALRLKNGNTLITDEHDNLTREVNPKGETVWEFKNTDLPEAYRFNQAPQSCTRLANGNTIFCSRGGGGKGPQLVEVTPDKKVVWVLQDWQDLGDATAVQILDDPGIPEIPVNRSIERAGRGLQLFRHHKKSNQQRGERSARTRH